MDFFPTITPEMIQMILPFIGVGFLAQLIDGALGMAFGVITNTLLVSVMGLAPARASASVHVVETFTTAASAISHIFNKNVDWKLFSRLVIPGMIGGVLGAYLLTNIDGGVAKPFVMTYLAGIGVYLLWKAWAMDHRHAHKPAKIVAPLGLLGGFLDAAGGGGWGPVVTSNLLAQGADPRMTIGTVNTSEFFLTATISLTFILTMGLQAFTIASMGLILGGLLAAPLGAVIARKIAAKRLLILVGCLLILTSVFSLYKALA
jgi:uncharacterized protein